MVMNNIFNTWDRELASAWLSHPAYDKYNDEQKEFILDNLSRDVRVQNPNEYDEPRLEFMDVNIYNGMIERTTGCSIY